MEDNGIKLKSLAAVALVTALVGCGGGSGGGGSSMPPPAGGGVTPISGKIDIVTLSNRADMISDGDAMVEVTLPAAASIGDLKVVANDRDVSQVFAARSDGKIKGVISGLVEGKNTVTASLNGTSINSKLEITNSGRYGNIFAGIPVQPWICATKTAVSKLITVAGTTLSANVTTRVSGLDGDPDDACNAPSKFTYFYQPKALEGSSCVFAVSGANACFIPYDIAARPSDAAIADFTNDRGVTAKSMLRLELGTMNRSLYRIVSYFDPAKPWTPFAPQSAWNQKLMWKMGCNASGNRFGQNPENSSCGPSVFDRNAMQAGFMVAHSQLTNHNDNNNELLAAENLMMIKEHIIDTYGQIRYTMSDGESGGSMMQTVIASVMPGLLDGIQPALSYPDAVSTWIETRDCGILNRYYQTASGTAFSGTARAAVNGHPDATYCDKWAGSFITPQVPTVPTNCGPGFPGAIVYDPVLRPNGVRCSIHDMLTPILGTVVDTDRNVKPNLPYDNVGVQYGLRALQTSAIDAEAFVALNEGVGSFNLDMVWSGGTAAAPVVPAARFRVDPAAISPIYKSGLISNGKNLAQVAIIDVRPNFGSDIHMNWRTFSQRARLQEANGTFANQVVFASQGRTGAALTEKAFKTMDRWLAAIEADSSADSRAQKVIKNKPADAVDFCVTTNGATTAELINVGLNNAACPVQDQSSPRIVSGGPKAEDIFKCQLKPLDFLGTDYSSVTFTTSQQTRLRTVFPDGVCDWTKPGAGKVDWVPTTFKAGPGGQPLPAMPVSTAS